MDFKIINPHHFNPRVLFIMRRFFDQANKTESHSHDFLSLIYILGGEGKYEVGGKIYDVGAGTFFICNPEVTHHRILTGKQRIEEFHVGISDLHLKGLPENYLIPKGEEPLFGLNRYRQEVISCINEIISEQQRNDETSVLMLKCIVMKLLVYIIKERYFSVCRPEKDVIPIERYGKTAMVDNIIAFLNENYMKPISLAQISANTYLSPVYVSKVFKDATGESPINYLIHLRLSKACELLESSDASVKEIARQVGYTDAYYFSKLFKKYYGISPMHYRKAGGKAAFRAHLQNEDKQM
ncbi:AraC family transcriptional regulator [Thermoclostridium stercorarium subsp. thermolacticum DSM 2910]|uniref:AraC family transcriptional regulator n=1 Tax=Thermoclostridium stercorarium subsp. thermolacticum DSM 2910 TaxID=1121336 RepID=A0A1B1YAM9_THEST|nr:AraC family transcriptional regulator [Thermoclostridium stercorarium]ANW97830.1 AraC family transcriptional regulator [Thermoclostridium stercorarium subsp. thermolacticum DSM 2910]